MVESQIIFNLPWALKSKREGGLLKKLPAPTEGTELKMNLLVSEKHMTNKLERATTSNIKRNLRIN